MPGTHKVMHSCLQIGSSKIFLHDQMPNAPVPKHGAAGFSFYLYVPDVDAAHKRAVEAGMKEAMAPADMFWGDRTSSVKCPYGYSWTFATHKRDVGQAELAEALRAMTARAPGTAH